MSKRYRYLGEAIKRPLTLINGSVQTSTGVEVLTSSILDILNTPKGSRLFLPEYGSRIHEVLFEPNDQVQEAILREFMREAIAEWEKRVRFIDVDFERGVDYTACTLQFMVLASNEVHSFVYPYYDKIIH